MKFIKVILISLSLFVSKTQAIELGPFDVGMTFCKDVQKIGSILNAFNITSFPVAGLPGVSSMITMRTSPIVDMCSFLNQVRSADASEAIFMTAEKLNSLTQKGYDDELALSRATFGLANSLMDFNTGKKRASTLDAVYTSEKLGGYMKKLNRYRDDSKNKDNEKDQAEQISNLSKIARERAILEETSRCPKPPEDNKDYSNVYASEYEPKIADQEFYQRDMDFSEKMLLEMGPRFLKDSSEWKTYELMLNKIMTDGVTYTQSVQEKIYTTYVKTGVQKIDKSYTQEQKTVKKNAQVFSTQINDKYFDQFESKFQYKWTDWVSTYWSDSVRAAGIQVSFNPDKNVNSVEKGLAKEFSVFSEECAPSRLVGKSYNPLDSNQSEYQRKLEECADKSKMDKRKAASLFSLYLRILKNSVNGYKRAKAAIWSLDSLYLGRNRVVSTNMKDDIAKEEIVCSTTMSIADMELLALKNQGVNAKLNQAIAEETMKQSQILEAQAEREKQIRDDQRIRQQIADEARQRDKRNNDMIPKSVDM